MASNDWLVYMLLCPRKGKDTFYVGITNNYTARLEAHVSGNGAKYTRSFPPIKGQVIHVGLTRSMASKLEHQYKALTHDVKRSVFDLKIMLDMDMFVQAK